MNLAAANLVNRCTNKVVIKPWQGYFLSGMSQSASFRMIFSEDPNHHQAPSDVYTAISIRKVDRFHNFIKAAAAAAADHSTWFVRKA